MNFGARLHGATSCMREAAPDDARLPWTDMRKKNAFFGRLLTDHTPDNFAIQPTDVLPGRFAP